jgi:hypothetical protein
MEKVRRRGEGANKGRRRERKKEGEEASSSSARFLGHTNHMPS